jgi:hypothetical protein
MSSVKRDGEVIRVRFKANLLASKLSNDLGEGVKVRDVRDLHGVVSFSALSIPRPGEMSREKSEQICHVLI